MPDAGGRRAALPELLIGLGLLAASAFMAAQIRAIPVSPLYSKVGPTVFPSLAAGGMAVLALLLILQALRGGWQPGAERETRQDWLAVALVGAGLVANLLLIGPLGFTLASAVMFVLVALGFGDRRVLRAAAIGFTLALAAYFGFARALGVNIGAGLVERALGG